MGFKDRINITRLTKNNNIRIKKEKKSEKKSNIILPHSDLLKVQTDRMKIEIEDDTLLKINQIACRFHGVKFFVKIKNKK